MSFISMRLHAFESFFSGPYLLKRNGVYYGRYHDENGIERKRSLKTTNKEIAQAKLAKLIEKVERREVGWDSNDKPVDEYLKEYLTYCENEHTLKSYSNKKRILNDFVAVSKVKKLRQITPEIIESYKAKRGLTVKKASVNKDIAVLKAFLNRAVMLGHLAHNPAQYIKRLKEEEHQIQFLSDEAVKKLLAAASPKFRQIIVVFLLTGMRLGEFLELRSADIDFRRKQIIIQNKEGWTTKNKKPRVIPMHSVVERILQGLPKDGKYVFPSESGNTLRSYIHQELSRYAKNAGIKANFKIFRSTFASNLVMSGVDIYAVSKLLGHHDVKITEKHYAHLTPDYLGKSITKLNFMSGKIIENKEKRSE